MGSGRERIRGHSKMCEMCKISPPIRLHPSDLVAFGRRELNDVTKPLTGFSSPGLSVYGSHLAVGYGVIDRQHIGLILSAKLAGNVLSQDFAASFADRINPMC